jgi:hypothetical protein
MDASLLLHPIHHYTCYLSKLRNKWYMLTDSVRKTSKLRTITSTWCFNSKLCVFILVQAENEEFQKKVMEDGSMKWFNLKSLPLTTQVCTVLSIWLQNSPSSLTTWPSICFELQMLPLMLQACDIFMSFISSAICGQLVGLSWGPSTSIDCYIASEACRRRRPISR